MSPLKKKRALPYSRTSKEQACQIETKQQVKMPAAKQITKFQCWGDLIQFLV